MGSIFWLPDAITELARGVDGLFWTISIIAAIVFILVEVLLVAFVIRYRRKSADKQGLAVHGNTKLEFIWTVVPALILVGIGIYSTQMVYAIQKPPAEVYEIQVVGHKWYWEFKYPNGASTTNELVVPQGKNVLFKITSADVVHSFWVPNFRIKQDAVPGRETRVWVNADQAGDYKVLCAEYCGTKHAFMVSDLQVIDPAKFDVWLVDAKKKTDAAQNDGKALAQKFGCLSCHSIDGSKSVGPTWKGLFGSESKLQGGQSVKADEKYLIESIKNPGAKVVDGFPNAMPPFAQLDDKQLQALVKYIEEVK